MEVFMDYQWMGEQSDVHGNVWDAMMRMMR